MKKQRGFTLLDIMIACAVAAILALCAMPSFMLMAEQRQARAALGSLDAIRSDLTGYLIACDGNPNLLTGLGSLSHYQDRTNCATAGPPQNVQGGPVGSLLSSVSLNGLSLSATVGGGGLPALTGQQFHLSGTVIGSAVSWTCSVTLPGVVLATHC